AARGTTMPMMAKRPRTGCSGMAKYGVATIRARNHNTYTTQPCHVNGNPHPRPSRFAANQYRDVRSMARCSGDLTTKLSGRPPSPDRRRECDNAFALAPLAQTVHGPLQRKLESIVGRRESPGLHATPNIARPRQDRRMRHPKRSDLELGQDRGTQRNRPRRWP